MYVIGLTGGIGAGKSTVAHMFSERGVPVIDADQIAREVVEPGQEALAQLVDRFGDEIITSDGHLDRQALARVAFASSKATAALNAIVHPAVEARTQTYFARYSESPVVVHDVPLLVELELMDRYDLTVVVDTPADIRLHRLVENRGLDVEDAKRRIAAQVSDEQRRAACDVALNNAGTVDELRARFDRMWEAHVAPHMVAEP